ncbi:hypothetical protein K4K57_012341 [Colletotrichum sp. SAR 10_99]|nr:hypothetical protein K4K57_012341 [Colletotrichum sp. SAR 10_99]
MDVIPVICQALGADSTPLEGLQVNFYTSTLHYQTTTTRDGRIQEWILVSCGGQPQTRIPQHGQSRCRIHFELAWNDQCPICPGASVDFRLFDNVIYYITIYVIHGAFNIYYETGPNLASSILSGQWPTNRIAGQTQQSNVAMDETTFPVLHKLQTSFSNPRATEPVLVAGAGSNATPPGAAETSQQDTPSAAETAPRRGRRRKAAEESKEGEPKRGKRRRTAQAG